MSGIMEATTAMRPFNVEGSFSLMGSKGSAKVGGFALNEMTYSHLNIKINKKRYKTNPSNVYGYGHIEFYKNVYNFLHNKKNSATTLEEGSKSVKIIDKIYSSAEISKEVFFNDNNYSKKLGK